MTTIRLRELLGPHLNRSIALSTCEEHPRIAEDSQLVLDFCGCLIDYPETAQIVEVLTGRAPPRLQHLSIKTDQDFPDQLLLNLLLKGGSWWPLGTAYDEFLETFGSLSTGRPKHVSVIILDFDNIEKRRIEL